VVTPTAILEGCPARRCSRCCWPARWPSPAAAGSRRPRRDRAPRSSEAVDPGEDGLIAEPDRPLAPALAGTTLEGEPLDVADYRGQVVVLNFWASWCPPCRAEAGNLVEVAQQTEAEGVQFIGVNVKNAKDEAIAFERKAGVPYPSLHDQPGVLLTRFRELVPQVPPTTLILDREGRIAGRFIGGVTTRELLVPVRAIAAEPSDEPV
jgi:thiol-disulfide isomerase/thioredoxin